MSVFCTVIWDIKPDCVDDFVSIIGGMFSETKTHDGFISIRLHKSDTAERQFILVQEWQTTRHHQAYVDFRGARGDLDLLAAMTAGPTLIHYWKTNPMASA